MKRMYMAVSVDGRLRRDALDRMSAEDRFITVVNGSTPFMLYDTAQAMFDELNDGVFETTGFWLYEVTVSLEYYHEYLRKGYIGD